VCSVQNGFKPAALEVDAGCTVGNEVAALVVCGRRDSGVDDLILLFLHGDCLATTAHELTDIRREVDALSTEASNGSDLSRVGPSSKQRV